MSTLEGAAARARVLSVGAARALLLEKQRQRQQQRPSGMDTPPPLLLHLRGRVAGVGVGAERAPLFHSPPPEEGGMDEDDVLQGVLGRLVVRGAGDDGEGECAGGEGQWRYRDVFLRVVDAEAPSSAPAAKAAPRAREEEEAEAAAGEGEGEGEGLWVRVPDAVLRPLLAHVPPGRLVEEAEAAAAAAAEEDTAAETHDSEEKAVASGGAARLCSSPSSSFFYARWVLRAARALASPRNPPFRMTVRVDAAAAAACATAAVAGAVAPRGLGGILASQLSCGGGTGGVEQQQPKLELDLVRLAEAPVEGEEDAMEDGAGGGE